MVHLFRTEVQANKSLIHLITIPATADIQSVDTGSPRLLRKNHAANRQGTTQSKNQCSRTIGFVARAIRP